MIRSVKVLFLSIIAIAVIGGFFAWFDFLNQEKRDDTGGGDEELAACTQDAKLCPDGSYVGRTSPKCEFAPCPSAKDENDPVVKKSGAIAGKVTIGPLCPVEPCKSPIPDPYSSRQIILESQDNKSLPIHLQIDSEGKFQGEIPVGTYKATITACEFLGCKYMPPKTVVVEASKIVEVDINIDTGIR